jgi:hypothetical protein
MTVECSLKRERSRVTLASRGQVVGWGHVVGSGRVNGPNARGMVGGTSGQVTNVGGEEDAGDVGCVSHELADGEDRGGIATLDHAPNIDIALPCGVSKLS